MSKNLKIALYVCFAGLILGAMLLFSATANANADSASTPTGGTSQTTGETGTVRPVETPSVAPDNLSTFFAPGGIITISLGGILLIVREINAGKKINVDYHKDRADRAESQAAIDTQKLVSQIERLEAKLDAAIKDTESKHDLYVAEITHRRRLELILAEHGIALPVE